MPISPRFCASFLIVSLTLAGCHAAPKEGTVATVNGKPITQEDVDKIYNAQLQGRPQTPPPPPEQVASNKLEVLHQLIVEEIAEQRAAKLNLVATDAEVENKITEMKAPYTEEQVEAQLKARHQTMDDVRHDLRLALTQEKLINKEINSRITITDADVTRYFEAHKSEFNLIDNRFHLAGIVVSGHPQQQTSNLQNNKAVSLEDAHKKIEIIKNRLDAGDDFGTLAMNFSEDPETAPNGGDEGFHYEGELKADPSSFAAVQKLKAGQTTDILPMLDHPGGKVVGYAIYKLISREVAGQRDLNDPNVQQAIRQQLHDSRAQLLKAAYFEMLRDQAKVENFMAEDIVRKGSNQ